MGLKCQGHPLQLICPWGIHCGKKTLPRPRQNPTSSLCCGGGLRKLLLSCTLVCIVLSALARQFDSSKYYNDNNSLDNPVIIASDLPTRKMKLDPRKENMKMDQNNDNNKLPEFPKYTHRPPFQVNGNSNVNVNANATANLQQTKMAEKPASKNLRKPVPSTMCLSYAQNVQKCQVQVCPKIETNHTQLPEFMRPFPEPHYGHGFIQRTAPYRGIRMQISGTASSGSGCALSHKYQFIFIHVLKSGGTTTKGFLQQGLCGSNQLPCAFGTDNLQIVDCAKAIAKYPQYFVFSFVRNPYSRMYSAYAMAHSYRYHPARPKPPFSFEAFALGRDPNKTTTTTTTTTRTQKQQQKKNLFRNSLSYLHPSHYSPQTMYLFTRNNSCPVVDFIGHLETLNEDLKVVLDYIGSPELWQLYEKRMSNVKVGLKNDNSTAFGDAKKKEELGGNLQTAYQYHHLSASSSSSSSSLSWTPIQKAVAEEYQRDFDLLGYDPNVVPS